MQLKIKQMFLKCFHNNLDIAVILAPDPEIFSAKFDQFPLIFMG